MSSISSIQSMPHGHAANDVQDEGSVKHLEAPKGNDTGDKKESTLRKIINVFACVILFIPRCIWKCVKSICNKISDCCGKSTKNSKQEGEVASKNATAGKTAAAAADQAIGDSDDTDTDVVDDEISFDSDDLEGPKAPTPELTGGDPIPAENKEEVVNG